MSACRVVGRWFSGKELDGERRTDARWRTEGRDTMHGVHDAWRWHYLPRAHRALIRSGGTVLTVLLVVAYWSNPDQTMTMLGGVGVLGVLVFAHWFWNWLQGFEDRFKWSKPLAVVLGKRWSVDPEALMPGITVPEDAQTNADHPAEIVLPAAYQEPQPRQEKTAKLIADKLKMRSHDFAIDHEGSRPVMLVRAMEVPPERVLFADVKHILDRGTEPEFAGRYFLGLGLRAAEIWADLNGDGPHWVWSCGTGAGKSTAARNVAAQVRKEGGRVVILDAVKSGDSHADWIYDEHGHLLDGIEHYTTVEEVHEALIRLGEERQKRSRLATQAKQFRRPAPQFQRVLVLFEEQNGQYDLLTDYWKYLRKVLKASTDEDQPETSPAMTATKVLIYAGRSALMNCFVSCQRFDAKIVGGGDVRGNFMVRMLSRFDEAARRMLIPDIDPKPKSSNYLGRAIVCMDGVATTFQGVLMEPDEAREWSSQDRPLVVDRIATSELGHEDVTAVCRPDQREQVSDLGPRTPLALVASTEQAPPPRKLTIKQAIEEGVVSGTETAVARAVHRAGLEKAGRDGKADTYTEDQFALLEERRVRRPVMS